MGLSILIAGDMHLPHWHSPTVNKFYRYLQDRADKKKPYDYVVQVGDLYDHYSYASFDRTHNLYTPTRANEKSYAMALEFWETIQKLSPKSKCIQMKGNHDDRPRKRLLEKAPELEGFFNDDRIYTFPGVETYYDSKEEVILDGIYFQHGHYSKPLQHLNYNLHSTVFGHLHKSWIFFKPIRGEMLFEMCVGYMADEHVIPLKYRKQNNINNWTLGFADIIDGIPRFIPT